VNIWRIDLILSGIYDGLGVFWLLVALAVIAHVIMGRLVRSLMTTIFVLVCTQVWWRPFHILAHDLRFVLLIVLAIRGAIFVARAPTPPGEGRGPRRVAVALGVLALASTMWSKEPAYTAAIAISFCLGLFVIFGLLWRIADDDAVIPSIAQGALAFAAVTFSAGFLAAAVAYATDSYEFQRVINLELGGRYSGVFYNPNAAGLIGAMVLPVIVAAPRQFLGRIAWMRAPVFVVTFATIFLSGSRSSLIGSAMAVVVLAMYRYGAGVFFTVGLGAIAVWALAVYSPLDDAEIDASAVGHISRTKHLSTLSGRVELWEVGWEAAQGHLVIGQGWGMSRDIGGGVDLEQAVENGAVAGATNLHNAHLQLLIDVGFVGVALFWIFCAMVMQAGWRILVAPRSLQNGLALVIFTSAMALIADTWVHGAIWSMGSPTTLAFWAVCALSLREGRRAHDETLAARAARPWPVAAPPDPAPAPAAA
jgi:O-antigen ligase